MGQHDDGAHCESIDFMDHDGLYGLYGAQCQRVWADYIISKTDSLNCLHGGWWRSFGEITKL